MVGAFRNGEIRVELYENVRGGDIFVVQSACRPVNRNIMELLVMLDALKRASAGRISAIVPYYGYGRQDQKDRPRVSITAKVLAELLSVAGADRIISVDLHATQMEGFFTIPVDNLVSTRVLMDDLAHCLTGDDVVVAPDAGGVRRARAFAERLGIELAIMDHRGVDHRPTLVGRVKGRRVIILDDMVDTGRTLMRTVEAAQGAGAAAVDAYCIHGVLSPGALEAVEASPLRSLVITDTIPPPPASGKLRVLSMAPMLAEAVKQVHFEKSISAILT